MNKKFFLVIILLFKLCSSTAYAQGLIDLESGIVSTGYNDVRIPGDKGTFFSMKDGLIPETEIFYRIRLNYTVNTKHTFSFLYAPLQIKSNGNLKTAVSFEGVLFPAQTEMNGTYKFNSYRFTYRYELVQKPMFEFGFGITAKVRDARIAISSSRLASEKTNVGFVPLINFRLLWKMNQKIGLLVDGDALAAPQGRAEDVLVAASYKVSDKIGVRAGYRMLEGGADNDVVYNFALFHYASVGFSYSF